jgi:RNA polymerase subunit RPABC4/transcription elongation factor Spt4
MNPNSKDTGALKKEKATALMSLGKLMHKHIRDGKVTDEACVRIADRIAQIDTEIVGAEGNTVPGRDKGVCPNCNVALASPMAAFCGGCGTDINEYYSRSMANCTRCSQLTPSDSKYCTVCGLRREGGLD